MNDIHDSGLPDQPPSSSWLTAARTLGVGVLLALGLRAFVAETRFIPSDSMVPTLSVGDHLIVEKLSYHVHPPQRGDVVVFKAPPALLAQNLRDDLIKRIIGLPGDLVEVKAGKVFVNGKALEESYVEAPPNYGIGLIRVPEGQYFVLGDNRNHSYDSHYWGFVPAEDIIGHAVWCYYPLTHWGKVAS
ncbi:signal peptidase I [Nodosilinea sp. LEGE 07298]|uniref:signal peptidase I n=1 Tax=Nodosilinea sp. LEGE 07298 TaxID=2777970 RepID=UPI00187E5734|nr:signal peptidase I [Nodosilinea sp. LEGE 07298]MBE9109280.1 signal peptidase I [Nodosilinea sp. LEGE 07298]